MARSGRTSRANAITNSPFVRALINPVMSIIPGKPFAAISPDVADSSNAPPPSELLIPTQPRVSSGGAEPISLNESQGSSEYGKSRSPPLPESVRSPNRETDTIDDTSDTKVVYTRKTLPKHLRKYWLQRYRLFTLFDKGCQLDEVGWFSVTPEAIAAQIAERCRCGVIVDAFCGAGGNAIQFAFTCVKVIAIDNSPVRLQCAKHNAKIYGVEDRIEFILADYPTWARRYEAKKTLGLIPIEEEVEVVFLSPPWGGVDYRTQPRKEPDNQRQGMSTYNMNNSGEKELEFPAALEHAMSALGEVGTVNLDYDASMDPNEKIPLRNYSLTSLSPLPGSELFGLSRAITPNIAFFLPRNTDLDEIANLVHLHPRSSDVNETELIGIEEEWMDNRLKGLTVYFGDLIFHPGDKEQKTQNGL